MTLSGADVAALRGLAGSLRRTQREIDTTRRRLAAAVESLPWVGSDHERFTAEWHRVHGPGLMTIAAAMSQASNQAAGYADRQEHASRRDR